MISNLFYLFNEILNKLKKVESFITTISIKLSDNSSNFSFSSSNSNSRYNNDF